MDELQQANGKKPSSSVQWKKKKKQSGGAVGPSPFEVPTVSVTTEGVEAASKPTKRSHKKKTSSWRKLKRRLTRKGVVAVNKDHPRYQILSCIREGIRQVSSVPDQGPKDALGPDDFTHVIKKTVNFKGKEFVFESYASSVFATIRRSVGVEEDVYLKAVAPGNLPYLEFISNSKSGQDFFLSNDMQFMFKSNRERDTRFFLCLLEEYLKHFIQYPHSLLVKYIGCYTIKFKGWPRRYFLVMQSIFFPSVRIEDRFDVKGCTAGRYQKPNPPDSNIVTVLKDQNFIKEEVSLNLGVQGDWFISQIDADTAFLEKHNCMDYSLLLGRQKRFEEQKKIDHVATVVDRIGLSIHHTSNIRLRAPSLDSEAVDSDRDDMLSNRSAFSGHNTSNNQIEISNDLKALGLLDTNQSVGAVSSRKKDCSSGEEEEGDGYDYSGTSSKRSTKLGRAALHAKAISNSRTSTSTKNTEPVNTIEDSIGQNSPRPSFTEEQQNINGFRSPALSATVIMPQVKPGLMFPRCLTDGVEKFQDEKRRLLPKCQNRLHIIDGVDYRYFLGVVDFLTRFDWRQKFAQHWKVIKYRCGEHSTKRPDIYRKRFVDFLKENVR